MFRCLARSSKRLPLTNRNLYHFKNAFKLNFIPATVPMTIDLATHMSTSEFSTSSPDLRNQPVSKIENYDPTTYKTLAFYKFHKFTKPELEEFRERLLIDLGELGIVGRIYISTEGINAQVSCPEECLPKLQEYVENNIKPLVGGDLMDMNMGTEHGKRSFRALHVRIRKQVQVLFDYCKRRI